MSICRPCENVNLAPKIDDFFYVFKHVLKTNNNNNNNDKTLDNVDICTSYYYVRFHKEVRLGGWGHWGSRFQY